MPLMFSAMRTTVSVILALWMTVFYFCGFGTAMPAVVGTPHHASHSTNPPCEQLCLAKSESNDQAMVGQKLAPPLPSGLHQDGRVVYASLFGDESFSQGHAPFPQHRSSLKRYQFLSNYRL